MENSVEKTILYTTMSNNIGQVSEDRAQSEIDRLTKQDGRLWRVDYSDFMLVEDETDEDAHNPFEKIPGNVWVTCEKPNN
jgi:hypothetical protein